MDFHEAPGFWVGVGVVVIAEFNVVLCFLRGAGGCRPALLSHARGL